MPAIPQDSEDGPINVTRSMEPRFAAISNLAKVRFELDGHIYASVEGFWQGLKFPGETDRERLASMSGIEAKEAGDAAPKTTSFAYLGQSIAMGSPEHHVLMERACNAKFEQDARARTALLATGTRILTHVVPQDSKNIPGVVMSAIWTRIRERVQQVSYRG